MNTTLTLIQGTGRLGNTDCCIAMLRKRLPSWVFLLAVSVSTLGDQDRAAGSGNNCPCNEARNWNRRQSWPTRK